MCVFSLATAAAIASGVPAGLPFEQEPRELERVLDPDAARAEGPLALRRRVLAGRIVQIHRVRVREHELHPAQRVVRTRLLAKQVRKRPASSSPSRSGAVTGGRQRVDDAEPPLREVARVDPLHSRQNVVREDPRWNRPGRIQDEVADRRPEDPHLRGTACRPAPARTRTSSRSRRSYTRNPATLTTTKVGSRSSSSRAAST